MGCLFSKRAGNIPAGQRESSGYGAYKRDSGIGMTTLDSKTTHNAMFDSGRAGAYSIRRSSGLSEAYDLSEFNEAAWRPSMAARRVLGGTMEKRPRALCKLADREGKSVMKSPPPEQLLVRGWLKKRGHMLRTWKKRYFVLSASRIRYYARDQPVAPYGIGLKGDVSLRGACLLYLPSNHLSIQFNVQLQ
jgi:PH domain